MYLMGPFYTGPYWRYFFVARIIWAGVRGPNQIRAWLLFEAEKSSGDSQRFSSFPMGMKFQDNFEDEDDCLADFSSGEGAPTGL